MHGINHENGQNLAHSGETYHLNQVIKVKIISDKVMLLPYTSSMTPLLVFCLYGSPSITLVLPM